MAFYAILSLFGGLALFLFGMNIMSSNLEKMAGGAMETALRKVTSNKIVAFLLGSGVTAVIQSSSALTVMLVGLVNSGIIPFDQTLGIILGSNVGTTLTAWIMTLLGVSSDGFSLATIFSPECFVPVLAFVGILLRMISKKEKAKDIGTIMLGFSVLMYGMTFMSDAMGGFADNPAFQSVLVMFKNPLLALLVAVLFTGIIQSSSAAIGIFQALALNGIISFSMALPMVLGANIGTTVTALISSIGSNTDAKRVTYSHLIINSVGALIMMCALYIFNAVTPVDYLAATASSVDVALIHTAFNLFNVVLFMPLEKPFIALIKKIVPEKQNEKTKFLDERLLSTPAVAVSECCNLTNEMAYIAEESVLKAMSLLIKYRDDVAETIVKDENELDRYEDKLGTFLMKLGKMEMTSADAGKVNKMEHSITNFERMGDHALNIRDCILKLEKEKQVFSGEALEELKVVNNAISEILDLAVMSFIHNDLELASHIEPLEEVIDGLIAKCLDNHINRLGLDRCSLDMGFVFSDILGNCERISDHCSNIGVCIIESAVEKYDMHKYLKRIKHESEEFKALYQQYKEKYQF